MPAILPIINFLAVICCVIPFPWHYRTRNIPTMMNMIWIGQANLFRGIDAIIWNRNVRKQALIYCDITLQLQIASYWGMAAVALCITRHLESVASPRYSASGLNDPRNRKIFEIFMCIIAPFIFAGLHLIVQGHRFDIIENIGCTPTTYWSWASIFLVFVPLLVLGIVNSIYAVMALRWFIQRRAQFHDVMSTSGFTASRYIRLMGLAMAELIGVLGINLYILASNAKNLHLRPWISWDYVHSNFKRVDPYPFAVLSQLTINTYYMNWAYYPISAVLFFAFFGFGQEAMVQYKKTYHYIRVHIFRRPPVQERDSRGKVGLPSFIVPDSMASKNSTKAQLSSSLSTMSTAASQKYDATLSYTNDSLYDTDERRGQRTVALNDLESAGGDSGDFQTVMDDEKSFASSPSTPMPISPIPARTANTPPPQIPMPTLTIPPITVHLPSFSRAPPSSDQDSDKSAPTTPQDTV